MVVNDAAGQYVGTFKIVYNLISCWKCSEETVQFGQMCATYSLAYVLESRANLISWRYLSYGLFVKHIQLTVTASFMREDWE